MDRAVLERALRALAEIGAVRTPVPEPSSVVPGRFAGDGEKTAEVAAQNSPKTVAPCGSPHCAGCYDVGDGRKVHPRKCGEDYREWLLKWEGKGPVQ